MPRCLGTSGLVRARQMPMSARAATEVQTFWPSSRQPPSTRVARVVRAARSEPAPGSLNSWHQRSSPRRVGATHRSVCSGVPWARMVGRAQPATARLGRRSPASAQTWSMTSCSTGPASRPHGEGQCGTRRPSSARARRCSSGSSMAAMVGDHRGELGPEQLGLGRQLDGEETAVAGQGQPGRLRPQRRRAADQLAEGGGPAQVDVGVVLPGEAHAPEDLDGPLGRLHVAVEGQARRPAGRPAGSGPGSTGHRIVFGTDGTGARHRGPGPRPRWRPPPAPPRPACRPDGA